MSNSFIRYKKCKNFPHSEEINKSYERNSHELQQIWYWHKLFFCQIYNKANDFFVWTDFKNGRENWVIKFCCFCMVLLLGTCVLDILI